MQGISGRSDSELCFALNNVGAIGAAHRAWKPPARRVVSRVKSDQIK